MKLSHIRDVLAIAAQGSLRKAGRQIGVAQPAITRSIQEIGQEVGALLFQRMRAVSTSLRSARSSSAAPPSPTTN